MVLFDFMKQEFLVYNDNDNDLPFKELKLQKNLYVNIYSFDNRSLFEIYVCGNFNIIDDT